MSKKWGKISCYRGVLNLKPTLTGGQSFRWKALGNDEWIGVHHNTVWNLKQTDEHLLYTSHKGTPGKQSKPSPSDEDILRSFFRLEVNLSEFYEKWSQCDGYFKELSKQFYGIRILNQDLVETIFSFICSSNNNIARITSMVQSLCSLYGTHIKMVNNENYYSFPSVESLTKPGVESELRKAGLGYRAGYVFKAACKIQDSGGMSWLNSLRMLSYEKAKLELMTLPGVGAKVADCICLMALGHLQAIPVDTHIYQIAAQRYLPHLRGRKSVTSKVYNEVSGHFQQLFGSHAGWAHTVLFCADLRSSKNKSTAEVREGDNEASNH